ncbi:hypothetical protein N1851_021692 [Merluccius polli]|uniref:Uncharacterized protein n=1 Tax=Merluccius polli TaxID=89951 RepID=A0AA47MJM3_MERPO|nr:hypothetical protein N1851_021692 [Merluccius polli]
MLYSILRLTWLLCLIGSIFSLPVDKGFGSNNPSPALTDLTSPDSAHTDVGKNSLVYSTLHDGDGRVGPLTWFQQSSDSNAGGGVYNPITDGSEDFYMEENPEEFVWIDVYDLEPGYSFSYQQGGQFAEQYLKQSNMVGHFVITVRLTTIFCLIGGIVSRPANKGRTRLAILFLNKALFSRSWTIILLIYHILVGFGSKKYFPASTDFSAPGSAHPNFGQDSMVHTSGNQAQDDYSREWPSTWSQQSSDPNAKGAVYPNRDSTNAGSSGWAKNSGLDSYYTGPDGLEGNSKELQTSRDEDLEEDPEEESVLSEVSDLEPVYSFSSRSRYQHGRRVFVQTTYTPGEVMATYPVMPVVNGKPAEQYLKQSNMVGHFVITVRLTTIFCLIGGMVSRPANKGRTRLAIIFINKALFSRSWTIIWLIHHILVGFGSKKYFPASTDFSAPGSAHPNFGQDSMVHTSGNQAQDDYSREWPSTWSQQSSDPNAKGAVYPNRDSTNAGSSGWAKNSGLDSYYTGPDGLEGNSKELQTSRDEDLEEDPEEESVLSEVSDLEPVYSFSSRSRYQHGRRVFVQTTYTPGEVMATYPVMPVVNGKPAEQYLKQSNMVGHFVITVRLTTIFCLIGGIVSRPANKGFGSKKYFPASTDFSAPGSAHPNFGQDSMVHTSGNQAQDDYSREWPSTWSQQSSDPNAKGAVYPNRDSTNAGSSGWAKNSGLDSYYTGPDGLEGNSKELQTSRDEDLEEDPEEESVLSEVSDLEPVYSFSSRSRYQHGRRVFVQTTYTPGEVMATYPVMPVVNGKPAGPQWLTTIFCLIGGIVSTPANKGFGSKRYFPASTDFSAPGSAHPNFGQDSMVHTSGNQAQDDYSREWPSTWSQQSSDSNAKGAVYPNRDSTNAGSSGWAKNSGLDSYYTGPDGVEGNSKERQTSRDEDLEEDPEEESVLSEVSDLEPVYSFSSRSRYQHGRRVFVQTTYTPGEVMVTYPVMPVLAQRNPLQHGLTSAVLALLFPTLVMTLVFTSGNKAQDDSSRAVTQMQREQSTQMVTLIQMLVTPAGPRTVVWTLITLAQMVLKATEELLTLRDEDLEENPEESVLSEVSDLEPVYSFSSRSSYQHSRWVFVQTTYTPGEIMPPLLPCQSQMVRGSSCSKTSSEGIL